MRVHSLVRQATEALARDDFGRALGALIDAAHELDRLPLAERAACGIAQGWGATSAFKLRHDLEQREHLARAGILPTADPSTRAERALALASLPAGERMHPIGPELAARLGADYGRIAHLRRPAAIPGGALHPDTDWARIEAAYLAGRPRAHAIDRVLGDAALAELRAVALDSVIWHDVKPRGHVAARLAYGLASELLFQIAAELKARLPRVIGDLPLQTVWAFKYGPTRAGIDTHADGGRINVNLWLTPDDANLSPARGGMLVHALEPAREWRAGEHATYGAVRGIRAMLAQAGAEVIRVPYAANRAALFDSKLFHESDEFEFVDRYDCRRVSVTFLFGEA